MKIAVGSIEITLNDSNARELANFLLSRREFFRFYDDWGWDYYVIRTRRGGVIFIIPTKTETKVERLDERSALMVATLIKVKLREATKDELAKVLS
ncbi:MAG: hypothetical protein DRN78_00145 [Thermoproteota archaeon]|nr:MAG: hypothetical protein DRN78_00145 [Candidatus Korarchaeota archaeon]